jgi:hypothetical protein
VALHFPLDYSIFDSVFQLPKPFYHATAESGSSFINGIAGIHAI